MKVLPLAEENNATVANVSEAEARKKREANGEAEQESSNEASDLREKIITVTDDSECDDTERYYSHYKMLAGLNAILCMSYYNVD